MQIRLAALARTIQLGDAFRTLQQDALLREKVLRRERERGEGESRLEFSITEG